MSHLKEKTILTIIFITLARCGAPETDPGDQANDSFLAAGKTDTGGIMEGSPEALGVLKLVNVANLKTLDDPTSIGGVGLQSLAANNIVDYRNGADLIQGTTDDNLFATLQELDDIPYVGPIAFARLLAFARANGYLTTTGGGSAATCDTIAARYPAPASRDAWTWKESNGIGFSPFALDTARGVIVGYDGSNTGLAIATWESGTSPGIFFAKVADETESPALGDGASMAYDPIRQKVVMFGGDEGHREAWEWDGNVWVSISSGPHGPDPRTNAAMTWDPELSKVVMYGGIETEHWNDYLTDLWAWDGQTWEELSPSGNRPPWGPSSIAFHQGDGRLYLVLGGGIWAWDEGAWQEIQLTNPSSSPNIQHGAVAYDAMNDQLVKFTDRGSWKLQNNEWQTFTENHPSYYLSTPQQALFDETNQSFIMGFGGGLHTLKHSIANNNSPRLAFSAPEASIVTRGLMAWPDETITIETHAEDPDGDLVYYDVITAPTGATFAQGLFSWSPTAVDVGLHQVQLAATDGEKCHSLSFEIEVQDPSYPSLPTGDYLFVSAVQVPSTMFEYKNMTYLPDAEKSRLDHGDVTTSVSCELSGKNPGKIMLTCDVNATEKWLVDQDPWTVWSQTVTHKGQAPISQDGTFSFYATGASHTPETPLLKQHGCSKVKGALVVEQKGQLRLVIDSVSSYFHTCEGYKASRTAGPRNNSATGWQDSTGGVTGGYQLAPPNTVTNTAGLDGDPLARATFWQESGNHYFAVDTYLWLLSGGVISDLDGNHLGRALSIPVLNHNISSIGTDASGNLVVN